MILPCGGFLVFLCKITSGAVRPPINYQKMQDNTPIGSAADMADTGQWRLEAVLSRNGVSARLRAIGRPGVAERPLLDTVWENDEEGLLKRIENAVYDHPQVLDDYSALIIIDTPLTTWAPADTVPDEEDRERVYTTVYGGEPEEVMADDLPEGGPVAMYTLAPGLRAFLGRTFPGARVRCHQSLLVEQLTAEFPEGESLVAVARRNSCDIAALSGGELMCIATHPALTPPDIAYHLLSTAAAAGIDHASACVRIVAAGGTGPDTVEALRPFCSDIRAVGTEGKEFLTL